MTPPAKVGAPPTNVARDFRVNIFVFVVTYYRLVGQCFLCNLYVCVYVYVTRKYLAID